jgi:hypothetical protein
LKSAEARAEKLGDGPASERRTKPEADTVSAKLERLQFRNLELPDDANKFEWTIGAFLDGRCVAFGTHHLKSEATEIARNLTKRELLLKRAEQQLGRNGILDFPASPSPKAAKRRSRASIIRLHETIRTLGEERGRRSEDMVFQAFAARPPDAPAWFKCLRRPTLEQDRLQQIDVIVETHDLGELYIQVKSSLTGLRRFEEKWHPANVRGLVVSLDQDDARIRALVYDACAYLRAKRLRGEI